ncbi:MAG: site-specific integrase [Lachnospiraceae bacterium]|nr:site-specific integrase [Lachnospiraceae bacterium]
MKDEQFFRTVRSFFDTYLVKNRSCSPNTVKSYKDALNLYLDFLEDEKNIPTAKVCWNCFRREFVQEFLTWLEEIRGCSKQTQRQRLAAIRSFIEYGGILDVCTVAIQADVGKIKFRKPPQKLVHWLTKEELAVFLSQPDGSKKTGLRDMVFLTVMYDTAARCQEMIDLKIQDLSLTQTTPCIYLTGKGSKTRVVPLLPKTAQHLKSYLDKFHPADTRSQTDYVFYTHSGPKKRMSEDTVAAFVKKYGLLARQLCSSIPERVHPHMLRHTRAMHLYQDGVPLPLISEFLGHAQIETTKVYAYADTEMKRKAIQKANSTIPGTVPEPVWKTSDKETIRKLAGLK